MAPITGSSGETIGRTLIDNRDFCKTPRSCYVFISSVTSQEHLRMLLQLTSAWAEKEELSTQQQAVRRSHTQSAGTIRISVKDPREVRPSKMDHVPHSRIDALLLCSTLLAKLLDRLKERISRRPAAVRRNFCSPLSRLRCKSLATSNRNRRWQYLIMLHFRVGCSLDCSIQRNGRSEMAPKLRQPYR